MRHKKTQRANIARQILTAKGYTVYETQNVIKRKERYMASFRATNPDGIGLTRADVIIDTQWDDYNIYELVPDWMGSDFLQMRFGPRGKTWEIEGIA